MSSFTTSLKDVNDVIETHLQDHLEVPKGVDPSTIRVKSYVVVAEIDMPGLDTRESIYSIVTGTGIISSTSAAPKHVVNGLLDIGKQMVSIVPLEIEKKDI